MAKPCLHQGQGEGFQPSTRKSDLTIGDEAPSREKATVPRGLFRPCVPGFPTREPYTTAYCQPADRTGFARSQVASLVSTSLQRTLFWGC